MAKDSGGGENKGKPDDVQEVAVAEIQLLEGYHESVDSQSRRIFTSALIGMSIGVALFIAAISYAIWSSIAFEASVIMACAGGLTQFVSGIMLLYGKAVSDRAALYIDYRDKLLRYRLASGLCETLQEGQGRDDIRSGLIYEIAGVRVHKADASS